EQLLVKAEGRGEQVVERLAVQDGVEKCALAGAERADEGQARRALGLVAGDRQVAADAQWVTGRHRLQCRPRGTLQVGDVRLRVLPDPGKGDGPLVEVLKAVGRRGEVE